MTPQDNYILLIRKLDEFIRKYYKNQLIRGGLYSISLFALFFLLVNLTEYFARFDTLVRTTIFYAYIFINAVVLIRLVIIPVLQLFRIGKVISHDQAAAIIGKHFTEVSDKLLNTLQLKRIASNGEVSDLINASINQKIEKLKPVPFMAAIDFRQNRKYLKYVLPPVVLILFLLLYTPKVITEPTTRLVNHDTYYEAPIPFHLTIENDKLEVLQREDFIVKVKAEGEELPAEVFIDINGLSYKMQKKSPVKFQYTFKSLQSNKKFVLSADRYRSEEYEIRVIPKPIVLNFEIVADYPSYTGKNDETFENTGDLVIPQGTVVNWKFFTRDTKKIGMVIGNDHREMESANSNVFSYRQKFLKSTAYSIMPKNEFIGKAIDSITYTISVIPDAYPSISVEQVQDSIYDKRIYFRGLIKDDYGFSRLTFNVAKIDPDKETDDLEQDVYQLPVSANQTQQQFFHFLDLDSMHADPGEQLIYHFEVWDNDGVNGAKMTRSGNMVYQVPTLEEIEEKVDEQSQNIKDELEKSIREAQNLQKKIEEMNRKLLEKESIGWQEKQQIQDLMEQQKELQDRIEKLQEENKRKDLQEQQFRSVDEELVRKQQQLQDIMDKIMTEEMKKMLEEMQKLMDEIDKDKVNEMLEKMKFDNKSLEKELDRNLELFKQLEFEMKLQDAIDKLKMMAEKQEELSKEDQDVKDNDKMAEEQKELNEEFEKFRNDLNELEEKNKELENPNKLENTDEQEESIQEDMQESLDELNNDNRQGASGKQNGASGKMKELSEQLMQMQSEMYSEELGEDIGVLREILENLVQLSFDEEDIIAKTGQTSTLDPKYVELIEGQKKIKDDLVMVEDSIWALSKRQPMIKPYVTKEIRGINDNVEKSLESLNDRRKGQAMEGQQYAMTSINNLALMLSEILDQMMQAAAMQSAGQCKKGSPKPGSGKPSMKSMKQMQQQLNKQIQRMKDQMGKDNQGKKPQDRNSSVSEELVRMAAQQEAIREMMEQYRQDMQEKGLEGDKEMKELIEKMEENETDLVNKIINQQTIERLKDIEVRMLKHEKAEVIKEMEEKRISTEAKNQKYSNPGEFLEYNRLKSKEVELLKTIPPQLKPFYKNKVNDYFYNVELK